MKRPKKGWGTLSWGSTVETPKKFLISKGVVRRFFRFFASFFGPTKNAHERAPHTQSKKFGTCNFSDFLRIPPKTPTKGHPHLNHAPTPTLTTYPNSPRMGIPPKNQCYSTPKALKYPLCKDHTTTSFRVCYINPLHRCTTPPYAYYTYLYYKSSRIFTYLI